jgi:2-polyprenyl-3-methyl-5-hydroxy-6-metoxy-1,4-benzoquinol methylase
VFARKQKMDKDPYYIGHGFFDVILKEIGFHRTSRKYLGKKEFEMLRQYYAYWMKERNQPYFRHFYSQRLKTLITHVTSLTSPIFMDCGCGLGSESIICGLLGARVVGIDLDAERLTVAKKRLGYYRDNYGLSQSVTFLAQNISTHSPNQKADIAFAREFMSHVYSVEAFLLNLSKCLRPNGRLIISDSNPINPYVSFNAWLKHRKRLFTYVPEPGTNKNICYALERLFSPHYLRRALKEFGFVVESTNYYGFVGPQVPIFGFIKDLENRQIHLFNRLGATFEIEAVNRMGGISAQD